MWKVFAVLAFTVSPVTLVLAQQQLDPGQQVIMLSKALAALQQQRNAASDEAVNAKTVSAVLSDQVAALQTELTRVNAELAKVKAELDTKNAELAKLKPESKPKDEEKPKAESVPEK